MNMKSNNLASSIKRAFIRATILSLAIVTSLGLFSGNLTGAFNQWVSHAEATDSQDVPFPLIDAEPLPAQETPQEGVLPDSVVAGDDAATLDSLQIDDALGGKPMYSRDQFGQAWSDDVEVEGGHNGCDTRNDILRRDLTDIVVRNKTKDCIIEKGKLVDPYTGNTVDFVRGGKKANGVDIDHIVPLANAWYAGAHTWDAQKRRNFANDPINLIATSLEANRMKKAKTADQWMPSNEAFTCEYAQRQIRVKSLYSLTVTTREKDALAGALKSCS
ncbi:HNH endonuclease family protein [Corynebacterium pseudotuberculosis]|uniref:HNH endonuclease family protein n=1 Tax=Corynebacterium pseudotuberculosis TaxID=1719 RepID=UPI0002660698|nr:HNH endonuclease family protein [Corynebacterium pseudotuberculosis]AFM07237.1 DUF1524 domain-containing protein [Corynebacterium pseudotuberculosis Cp162]WFP68057.1 HNH endonuclease family protein [Corynebacterium pseudotuberculosis]